MLLGAAVLWGCNAPMIKDLQSLGVSALAVADMRAVGAAVAFWVTSLFVGGGERVPVSMLGRLCVAGILCIVLNQVLFTVGVTYTSPIDATVIATMLPIVTMIFSAIILKETVTGAKLVGILVGAAGAVTLVLGGGGALAGGGLLGDALCLTAQVNCALYMVIFSNTIHRYSVVTLMKWLFLFAAVIVTMVTWPVVSSVDYAALPLRAWGEILFIVFGGTFLHGRAETAAADGGEHVQLRAAYRGYGAVGGDGCGQLRLGETCVDGYGLRRGLYRHPCEEFCRQGVIF